MKYYKKFVLQTEHNKRSLHCKDQLDNAGRATNWYLLRGSYGIHTLCEDRSSLMLE